MSIHEKTIKQLLRCRVHDLADIVMDMNIKQGRQVVLNIVPGAISVVEAPSSESTPPGRFYASLPPLTTPLLALENLEDMLSSVRAHQSQGAKR